MNNHSTLKTLIALNGGNIHQGIELYNGDQILIAVISNGKQHNLIVLPHACFEDDGSYTEVSPITVDICLSELKPKCTCPPTQQTHTPPCIYYAPSPQDIYKESLQ